MDYYGTNGTRYTLSNTPLGSGGEGDVYRIVNIHDKCAKIYHNDSRSLAIERKLRVMSENIPDESVLSQIAWPLDLLYNSQREFVGFVMPRIDVSGELKSVYEYPPQTYKNLTFEQKLIIAQNICAVIDGVHGAGFVFGDFNPNNIGVDMNTGHVAFWDTDTYHIYDRKTGITYRCDVCLDGYVAPELLSKFKNINPLTGKKYTYSDAPLETFTKETDNFALAIHIFKLIMNGYTPFGGIVANQPLTSTTAPGTGNIAVERDAYCFKPGNTHMSKAVPGKYVLSNEILRLFDRAFIDGRGNPNLRPDARDWYEAIESYSSSLVQCKYKSTHQYLKSLSQCPWCEVDKKFNVGIQNVNNRYAPIAPAPNVSSMPAVAPSPYLTNPSVVSQKSVSKPQTKSNPIKAEVIAILLCVVFVLGFYLFDKYKWTERMKPNGYRMYTDEIHIRNNGSHNKYPLAGTLEPDECDEYTIVTGSSSVKVDFVVHSSNPYYGVDLELVREDGSSISFNSFDRNELFADGYEISLPENETYRLRVSSPYYVDYVVLLDGYLRLDEAYYE